MEIVVFNCEQLRISVQTIILSSGSGAQIAVVNLTTTSCNSLVMVCIPDFIINSSTMELSLSFMTINLVDWVQLAEVKFYVESAGDCPSSNVINRLMPSTSQGKS